MLLANGRVDVPRRFHPEATARALGERRYTFLIGVPTIYSRMLPLLVTDVPSFLYWSKGNPFRSPILRDLAPAIDRLIVDSLTFAAPDLDLSDVATAKQALLPA